jgi:hypothetical protein
MSEGIKVKLGSFTLASQAVVDAAEHLGVQYLSMTTDAMFKRNFVVGGDGQDANRHVLIRTIKDALAEASNVYGEKVTERVTTGLGVPLSALQVGAIAMEAEDLSARKIMVGGASRQKKQGQFPSEPKVDFASTATLATADGRFSEDCIFGVEMQVRNNRDFPMMCRLPYYANFLARSCIPVDGRGRPLVEEDGKIYAKKVYECCFALWENDDENVGLIDVSGVKRKKLSNPEQVTGVHYRDIPYPICCAQFFLGKAVVAMEQVIEAIIEGCAPEDLDTPKRRKIRKIIDAREGKIGILKDKFNGLFRCDVDDLYNGYFPELAEGDVGEGYGEDDFTDERQNAFRRLESYELLELFSVGNVMTKDKVARLVSKTVRRMYKDMEIDINSVQFDEEQSGNIWISSKHVEDAERLKTVDKLVTKIAMRVVASENKIMSRSVFDKIVPVEDPNRQAVLNGLKSLEDYNVITDEDDEDGYLSIVAKGVSDDATKSSNKEEGEEESATGS